jgi:CubicO group peptidase (beta-lactamase class C family)
MPEPLHDLLHTLTPAIPALSLNVRQRGEELFHATVGQARVATADTAGRKADHDEFFDLASVTKILAGAPIAASLVADGTLDPEAPIAEHLPDVDDRITLSHLLAHSAGFPAHIDLWKLVHADWGTQEARRAVIDAARTTPLEAVPGHAHRYSDLGYLTLLDLLETASKQRLDSLFSDRVSGPANDVDLRWGTEPAAATERFGDRLVEGTVHDLNTAAMGGISTHAGLFGSARGVAALVEHLIASEAVRARWTRDGPGTHTGGWDTVSAGYSSTGGHFPTDTIGHLGYTGTSVWASPGEGVVVVLLTNRVHPHDSDESKATIRAARPVIHDAVAALVGWK